MKKQTYVEGKLSNATPRGDLTFQLGFQGVNENGSPCESHQMNLDVLLLRLLGKLGNDNYERKVRITLSLVD